MRPLESYIIYASLYSAWYGSAPFAYFVAAALAPLLLAHLVIEKPRWQFTLVYAYVSYLLYSIFVHPAVWPGGWIWIFLSTAFLIGCSAIACLFPVANFPTLQGSFQHVGFQHIIFDLDNKTPKYEVDMSHKELGVNVYYPSSTTASSEPGVQFISSSLASALGKYLGIPTFLFHPLTLARTRAVAKSPIASGKFPVVIFSHGLGGTPELYTIMASELASQGYVVLAPTHNDGSACLSMLNNTQIPFKRMDFGAANDGARQQQLQLRTAELEFVLDHLQQLDKAGPFAGHLDLDKIVLAGHSFGAATAVLTAARHPERIRAVITHDLWLPPLLRPSPVLPPGATIKSLLATCSEEWYSGTTNPYLSKFVSPDVTLVGFPETRHANYSDVPMFSQLLSRKLLAIGPIEFREAIDLINQTQVAYLKKVLQDKPEDFAAIAEGSRVILFENGDFSRRITRTSKGTE